MCDNELVISEENSSKPYHCSECKYDVCDHCMAKEGGGGISNYISFYSTFQMGQNQSKGTLQSYIPDGNIKVFVSIQY